MGQNTFSITRLDSLSSETADSLRNLAKQIGTNYQDLSNEDVEEMIASPMHNLFVAKNANGTIIGMILVLLYRIPYVRKAYFEDLIVDAEYRGHGLGATLMKHAIAFAKDNGAAYADCTSRSDRNSANNLYEKLGFQKRETNVYRMIFNYGGETSQ